jgi:hypothetical protein
MLRNPFIYSFLLKERGLRRGARSGNGSPLMGRKIAKLPRYPRARVSAHSNHLKSDSTNDVTRIRVTGKSGYDKWWTLIGENSAKVWYDISFF